MIKTFQFWKKFSKYLLVGLCAISLLIFSQTNGPTTIFAASCTPNATQPATSINSPANNSVFPLGTTNVTVSWNPVNIDGETYRVTTTNNNSGTVMPGQSSNSYIGTSIDIPVQNANSYTVQVIPQNACGSSSSSQVSFSIGSSVTSCSNANQCITCGSGDNYEQVCPTPQNNCQAVCPGGSTGQFSCSITQQPQGGNLYSLTGNPSNLPYQNYNWDLDGNFVYNDAQGPTIQRNFSTYTTIRLQVRDNSGNLGVCSTTINPSSTSGDVPTCYITPANPSSQTSPLSVNFTGNASASSGRYVNTYQWDFNGDGSFDSSSQYPNWTFNNSSNVRLRVVDSVGRENSCYTYVTVGSNQPPTTTNCSQAVTCTPPPPGCVYIGQNLNTCYGAVATCGTLSCNLNTINIPNIPNIPNLPSNVSISLPNLPDGNLQSVQVQATSTSTSTSQSNNTVGGSSSTATGGSSTVNITE